MPPPSRRSSTRRPARGLTWSPTRPDRQAAVIDPVLDYDWRSARTGTASADEILAHLEPRASPAWILETHAHADHLSRRRVPARLAGRRPDRHRPGHSPGAGHVQAPVRLGRRVRCRTAASSTGCSPTARPLTLGGDRAGRVIATPGHTSDSVSYLFGDALFVGDTVFMPDGGSARCDFPGGDAAELYRRSSASMACRRRRACSSATITRPGVASRSTRPASKRSATQHPRQGRHPRVGLRRHAPRARRHARRAEPDHPVGAGATSAPAGCRRPSPA